MRSDKIILYMIELAFMISLLCFVFMSDIFNKITMAVVLLVFMIIVKILVKSDKVKGKYNKKLNITMTVIAITYLAVIYILGIYTGFYNAAIKLTGWSIINHILPYIVIIILTEIIRKDILLKDNKKSNIIILIATVILEVALTTNIYNVKTLTDYYILIGFIIFSSIANNMLYNYIILKYRNCTATIIYRIITTIYVYIIPIIPNIHILFESILRVIMPYIIYIILENLYAKKEKQTSKTTKTKDIIITSILATIAAMLIMLISCQFKYGILVIGSESMTGTLNKSDAIIYKRLDKNEKIEIGDIIVFKQEGVRIIHRVVDKKDAGTGIKYFTKGDANINEDDDYRLESDIIGKVKLRIPYIGKPTILLNEMFE